MELLERDSELAILHGLLAEVSGGHGRMALVSGEAGIGKTALVEQLVAHAPAGIRTLWTGCEALFTPRELGPLYDLAQQAGSPLRTLLERDIKRSVLFSAVLEELAHSPTLFVVEDLHWADEATLDLLSYLARRISRTVALLVLTYREDELLRDHPLRLVLGELPTHVSTRLPLRPLSAGAVAALTMRSAGNHSAEQVYAITGGNPFFVTETLASETPGVPATVADAVRARISRRSPSAQTVLELVAVVPNRIEPDILMAMGAQDAALEECLAAGVLQHENGAIEFRHELARQAVDAALSPMRRVGLHRKILGVLLNGARGGAVLGNTLHVSPARLVHHATLAEDSAAVQRYAPEAARQAAAHGAHREAAAHYEAALRYGKQSQPEERPDLLDSLSHEQHLLGQLREAAASATLALNLWRELDRSDRVGRALHRLSRVSWPLGQFSDSVRFGREAVSVLEVASPSLDLAMAYANLSRLGLHHGTNHDPIAWGERAVEMGERLHEIEPVISALNCMGVAKLDNDDEQGRVHLEQSLSLALAYGYEDHAARAYLSLADTLSGLHQYAAAEDYVHVGLRYCDEHGLENWEHALLGTRSYVRLGRGDLLVACEEAEALLRSAGHAVTSRCLASIVLGQALARRGEPGAESALDQARTLAQGSPAELPVAAARAEWRWLQGDLAGCVAEAQEPFLVGQKWGARWQWAEVTMWLWRAGGLSTSPAEVPAPYILEMSGDWAGAAALWKELESPYEQALALAEGDGEAQREALAIFEMLGARPAHDWLLAKMRQSGVRSNIRGPNFSTLHNPAGLTNQQLTVLQLVAEGLSDAQIAAQLCLSPKTVGHHVSALLTKLDARSRTQLVWLARQREILP